MIKISNIQNGSFLKRAVTIGFIFICTYAKAQIISANSAYISITSGTTIGLDTINNDNTTTLSNAGTLDLYTINNAGTTQGNGTYNIARNFINTGTFSCGTSKVNYNGVVQLLLY